jgi:exonuclease VII large subunit
LTTVQRGYSVLRCTDDTQVIRSWQQVKVGERVRAELAAGKLLLRVLERNGDADATT